MSELHTIESLDRQPFKYMVATIGNLPTSFVDSMSYYEMLAWLCQYLEKTVIPAIDNNAEALEELQAKFVELKDYVDHYFDNLDVQEEINNKLDEMAEDGQLADIITAYLQVSAIIVFDTVADMKLGENLVDGSRVQTMGYRSLKDGGGALYTVREVTNQDNPDDVTIIALHDQNLVAELITSEVNLMTFGCYGDGTHDDTTAIQNAITYALAKNYKVTSPSPDKVYLISQSIKFRSLYVDLNMSTIKTNSAIDMLVWEDHELLGKIDNVIVDCNSVATAGMVFAFGFRCKLNHIKILNVVNYGVKMPFGPNGEHAWEIYFNNVFMNGGPTPSTSSVGFLIDTSDCYFNNIVMVNLHVNFDSTLPTFADISNIHCFNLNNTVNNTAIMFRAKQGIRWVTSHITCDGIPTLFKLDANSGAIQPMLKIDGLYVEYSDADFIPENGYTNNVLIDVPYISNTPRISILNGMIVGVTYEETGLKTFLMPNASDTFLGYLTGTTCTKIDHIGRKTEVTITNGNIASVPDNILEYKDGGIVNIVLTLKLPPSMLNQHYVNIGTIPEAFRKSTRLPIYGVMQETLADDSNNNGIITACYIDQTDGSIKISTPQVGTNPDFNFFKLFITYFK